MEKPTLSSSASSRVVGRSVSSLPRLASLLPFLGVRFKPPVSLSLPTCVYAGVCEERERAHLTSPPPNKLSASAHEPFGFSLSLPLYYVTQRKRRPEGNTFPDPAPLPPLAPRMVMLYRALSPSAPASPSPFVPGRGMQFCPFRYVGYVTWAT